MRFQFLRIRCFLFNFFPTCLICVLFTHSEYDLQLLELWIFLHKYASYIPIKVLEIYLRNNSTKEFCNFDRLPVSSCYYYSIKYYERFQVIVLNHRQLIFFVLARVRFNFLNVFVCVCV